MSPGADGGNLGGVECSTVRLRMDPGRGQTVSMSDPAGDYDLLRKDVGALWLDRDVVRVAGPDAVSFLQGQCSQDVAGLAVGESAWSFVLQPQGKVDALVRATRVGPDAMILDIEGGYGEALIARLSRFKL